MRIGSSLSTSITAAASIPRCIEFLMDYGMTRDEYQFFLTNNLRHHCIMGNDYYITNEHRVYPDGRTGPSGEIFGYARDHAGSITTAIACRSCTRKQT